MQLEEALRRAMSDIKVMSLDDYFLSSCFSITEEGKPITEWTLLFYNPRTNKTRDCFVNDKFVTLDDEMEAQKEMTELGNELPKMRAEDAIKTAQKKYGKKTINILVSLHTIDKPAWAITMIGADITATTFEIDANTGHIMKEDTTSLMKRL